MNNTFLCKTDYLCQLSQMAEIDASKVDNSYLINYDSDEKKIITKKFYDDEPVVSITVDPFNLFLLDVISEIIEFYFEEIECKRFSMSLTYFPINCFMTEKIYTIISALLEEPIEMKCKACNYTSKDNELIVKHKNQFTKLWNFNMDEKDMMNKLADVMRTMRHTIYLVDINRGIVFSYVCGKYNAFTIKQTTMYGYLNTLFNNKPDLILYGITASFALVGDNNIDIKSDEYSQLVDKIKQLSSLNINKAASRP